MTEPESEAGGGRGPVLIMAGLWLEELRTVTEDDSSIIYSGADLFISFFQQHE